MTDPLKALLDAGAVKTRELPANSRYRNVPIAQRPGADGTPIAYLRRRFVPAPERFATIGRYVLRPGERLDNVAATALGDPLLWWRIADANGALEPAALTQEAGDTLRLTLEVDMPGPPAGDES